MSRPLRTLVQLFPCPMLAFQQNGRTMLSEEAESVFGGMLKAEMTPAIAHTGVQTQSN